MDLPSHPESEETATGQNLATREGRTAAIALGIAVAVVVLIVLLHLTGVVGPGTG